MYRSTYGLPACTTGNGCFRKLNQSGNSNSFPAANTGWATEISLDLDMASAVCPTCKILLVEASSNSFTDLGAAENTAVAAGATVISNSFGSAESSSQSSYEQYFRHPGVAIFASSGDGGYGVEYPAASSLVHAVGGTTLARSPGSARGWVESAWAGAGSGCSQFFGKPSWQRDYACGRRAVADVAAVADPNTGVAVYDTFGGSGWIVVGGTSAASPLVASIYALTGLAGDDGRFAYTHPTLFFEVETGANGNCGSYLCTAVPGYDGPTGNGTPNGNAIVFGPPRGIAFYQNFYGDGDLGQCNALAYGIVGAPVEDWTPPIRIDTDNSPGGCYQQLGILDPNKELAGVSLTVDFEPDGVGQCDIPGSRTIPITQSSLTWSSAYRIDADNRPGGCQQKFTLSGPDVISFDVYYVADGDPGQCGNPGEHTITTGQSVTLRIDTDSRPGGCRQQFRIRKRHP
jgi:hypothetical protein